jgi:hypothetical protein
MQGFEQEIKIRQNTEQLVCLNLTEGSAQAD